MLSSDYRHSFRVALRPPQWRVYAPEGVEPADESEYEHKGCNDTCKALIFSVVGKGSGGQHSIGLYNKACRDGFYTCAISLFHFIISSSHLPVSRPESCREYRDHTHWRRRCRCPRRRCFRHLHRKAGAAVGPKARRPLL